MATWVWILIVIAVVVVVAVIAMAARQRRTTALRQRFGPEYDRAVEARQGRGPAEADLRDREKQRAQLDIRPLPEGMRVRFAEEWRDVQARFVDQPSDAVVAADRLVYSVMEARGYPMGDFDAQADLVSVDHPDVVENYRFAHGIHQRAQVQQAGTEDLREARLRYRSLFDELLKADDGQAAVTARRGPGNIVGQRSTDRGGLDPNADGQDAARSRIHPPKGPSCPMTDSESTHDRAPTTEQIATAGTADKERTTTGQHPPGDGQTGQPASPTQAGAGSGPGVGDQLPAQLLAEDEMQSILVRWKDIQAEFVDEPRRAVQDADALVADLMQRLARMFASERDQLESRWASGNDVSTEDLRHGLRRYRSFFERLLAA